MLFTDVFDRHTAIVFTTNLVKNGDNVMPMIRARSKCSFCSMNMYYTNNSMFVRNDTVTAAFYGFVGSANLTILDDSDSLFQYSIDSS